MRTLPKTTTVTTHELRIGDKVFSHGEVFELTGFYTDPEAVVRGFRTKLVETYWQEIPRHWVNDWHIQGNELARWAKVAS